MTTPRYRRQDPQTQQHYRFRARLYEIANRNDTEDISDDRFLATFDELLVFAHVVNNFDPCFALRQLSDALPRYANAFERKFPGLFGEEGMLRLENPARNLLTHLRESAQHGMAPEIPKHTPNIPKLVQLLEDDAAQMSRTAYASDHTQLS